MRCPSCGFSESRVIDSRPSQNGAQIRRRRSCPECSHRFTTYETFEEAPLLVVKKDGRREEFSREKLLEGFVRACQKRPVPVSTLENVVAEMAAGLREGRTREVPVQRIGELAVERLLEIDTIAYVRFVSVYKNFEEPEDFLREVGHLFTEEGRQLMGRRKISVRVARVGESTLPLPSYAHDGDAGVDLCNAGKSITLGPGERALVATGLAVAIPEGFELQIRPRSGLAAKHGLTVVNAPGTVDAGYRGEIGVILLNTDRVDAVTLEPGERVAQAVLTRCETISWDEVEKLDDTRRGAGGFGSTGREADKDDA